MFLSKFQILLQALVTISFQSLLLAVGFLSSPSAATSQDEAVHHFKRLTAYAAFNSNAS